MTPAGVARPMVGVGTSRRTLSLSIGGTAASTAAVALVNLVVLPLLLRRLGSTTYGAWATISSVLAIGALADGGVRTEIVRRVGAAVGAGDEDALRRAVRDGTSILAALSAGMLAVVVVMAAPVVDFVFPNGVPGSTSGQLAWVVRATALSVALSLVLNGYFAVLRGLQRGDVEAVALIASLPVGAAVTLAGAYHGLGLWSLLLGNAAQLLVQSVWRWVAVRRLAPSVRLRIRRIGAAAARPYLALSTLALLAQLGDVVDSQWDKIVLARIVGPTAVASFQVGTLLVLQAKAVSVLPVGPLLAAVSELRTRSPERVERTYRMLSKAVFVLVSVVLGAVFVFAPAFVGLWIGDATPMAGHAARLFTVAAVINLLVAPLSARLFGEGLHSLAALSAVANMVVNGVASFLLTVAIGFDGALYGSILGNAAGVTLLLVLTRRRLPGLRLRPPVAALAVGAALVAAAILSGLDRVATWPALTGAACCYVLVATFSTLAAERITPARILGWRSAA